MKMIYEMNGVDISDCLERFYGIRAEQIEKTYWDDGEGRQFWRIPDGTVIVHDGKDWLYLISATDEKKPYLYPPATDEWLERLTREVSDLSSMFELHVLQHKPSYANPKPTYQAKSLPPQPLSVSGIPSLETVTVGDALE
ncbi:MAG: hypothetical protein FWH42_01320 [Dehalococcoidia bacterium]|nr:hypothetical protein [Dehalococcoidia bacterium]